MLSPLVLAGIILILVSSTSATLLFRDVHAARLRERVGAIRSRAEEQTPAAPARTLAIRLVGQRSKHAARVMQLLRFNPDIAQQNVIPWKLVIAIACAVAVLGFFYGREFMGWPLAVLAMPVEGLFVARFIFGWERGRFQKALLEQIPDVMALICRAVAAGIPLSEALRSVTRTGPAPRARSSSAWSTRLRSGSRWKAHCGSSTSGSGCLSMPSSRSP